MKNKTKDTKAVEHFQILSEKRDINLLFNADTVKIVDKYYYCEVSHDYITCDVYEKQDQGIIRNVETISL